MAQGNVRHGRSSWEWETLRGRSELTRAAVAADQGEPPRKPKARKNRARWCGGHTGREHTPAVVEASTPLGDGPCGWKGMWDREAQAYGPGWGCVHEEACSTCGRRFRHYWEMPPRLCPAWPGTEAQHTAAAGEAARLQRNREERMQLLSTKYRRKPPVTGPQGYRRNRPK
jgi:hypothetical protein